MRLMFFLPRIRENKCVRACLCCWGLKGSHTVLSQAHPDPWMSAVVKAKKRRTLLRVKERESLAQDVCCFPGRIWVRPMRNRN